jgi:hypothetical protein
MGINLDPVSDEDEDDNTPYREKIANGTGMGMTLGGLMGAAIFLIVGGIAGFAGGGYMAHNLTKEAALTHLFNKPTAQVKTVSIPQTQLPMNVALKPN